MTAIATLQATLDPSRTEMRDFLRNLIAEHIHLVAMRPDGDAYPVGLWFGDDAEGAADWAMRQNANGKNVYWTVNRTRAGLNKKPSKTDMVSARFAHVDVDPPKDGSPWDRDAVLASFARLEVPPSFVVNSGGGFGAFWRLDQEVEDWRAIEWLNQCLEDKLDGDHCWNIDRLMRVPGSVNYPNARKRAAGRGITLASLAVGDAGIVVDPAELRKWLPSPRLRKNASRERVAVDGVAAMKPADLGISAPNRLLELIETPTQIDRSADTYAVACEMVRQGFDNKQIAGILLNADLPISASPREKADPMREVARAISRARQDALSRHANDDAGSIGGQQDSQGPAKAPPPLVIATPYVFKRPEEIRPREWVYGRSIQRGHLRAIVAQGGAGKTILSIGEALAMTTGRNLLGQGVPGGPKRVWLWNLEDDREELSRSIQAACKHHDITDADIGGRLFVDSALDGAILKLANSTGSGGLKINQPLVDALTDEMKARGIDYLHIDPFVSSHAVNENDNMEIDAVAKEWAMVAKNANAGIGLAHHVNKNSAHEANALSARGAVSLINACRSVLVLNRMSEDEAKHYGVGEERRRRFFRTYDDKNNRAPPCDQSDWFEMRSISLGNDPKGGEGDNMGVVVPWSPPDAFEGVTADHLRKVQAAVDGGKWRFDPQAIGWVGFAVASVMGFPIGKDGKGRDKFANLSEKARASRLIATWISNGALQIVVGMNDRRQPTKFVEVGLPAQDGVAPPLRGRAEQVEQVERLHCSTTTRPPTGVVGSSRGAGRGNGLSKSGVEQPIPAARILDADPVNDIYKTDK